MWVCGLRCPIVFCDFFSTTSETRAQEATNCRQATKRQTAVQRVRLRLLEAGTRATRAQPAHIFALSELIVSRCVRFARESVNITNGRKTEHPDGSLPPLLEMQRLPTRIKSPPRNRAEDA